MTARVVMLAGAVLVGVAPVSAHHAHADPLDELGFGAAASAMANARGALATGAEAVHANPAGVARVARPELLAGWHYVHERLELEGRDAGARDANGTSLGLAVPFEVGDVWVAAGVAVFVPSRFAERTRSATDEPHLVRFASAAQRVAIEPVVAASFGRLAIGAGASLLVDAASDALMVDVRETATYGSVDATMTLRAAPLVGLWWRPLHALELAVTARGELARDVALDARTNVSVPDAIIGDAVVSVHNTTHGTPLRAALAVAVHLHPALRLAGEISVERWRGLEPPVPDVQVQLAFAPTPVLATTATSAARYRNTATARVGFEVQAGTLRLRGGAAYLPSPLGARSGALRLADGTRTLATLGVGLRVPPGRVLLQPLDLDIAVGWQHVLNDDARAARGDIVHAGLTSTIRF